MTHSQAIIGASIFDGEAIHENSSLVFRDEVIEGIYKKEDTPSSAVRVEVSGGLIAPAYVDLQVNGGGGVQFNQSPNLAGIRTICETHAKLGTAALLVTLITDTDDVMDSAIAAGIAAAENSVPGFLGLHLEGPYLSSEKNGAHKSDYIKPMDDIWLNKLLAAKKQLPFLMVTVSPESVTNNQISTLSNAGIIVSLGHSNATFETAQSAANAGAKTVTHLFNAMSPLRHREPGMVGAALQTPSLFASMIADGLHVSDTAMSIALRSKMGPGKIFLITDSMAPMGTDLKSFTLNGRLIHRNKGQLLLEDGTLAGADSELNSMVWYLHNNVGITREEALRMASTYPAQCINYDRKLGRFKKGHLANIIHLNKDNEVENTWIHGTATKQV